ncbi:hypothetical protein Ocin01_04265 [Orchesella cincta]|uniref:Uncharacterized protein n=1 Tax=Orchesella cincta TaxID=48709 RepID=A0A1D2NAZ8_ORCCI|nr:hypothetical protein Ocin01_04265 [Orchesella cincta]
MRGVTSESLTNIYLQKRETMMKPSFPFLENLRFSANTVLLAFLKVKGLTLIFKGNTLGLNF